MDIKELYTKISEQNFRLRRVIANSVSHGGVIEQTKNLLYNNIDAIEEALKFAQEAEAKVKVLEVELADSESELDAALEKIKTLEKTTAKKKSTGTVNG